MNIIENTLKQLKKPTIGQIRFSDVYPEVESQDEKNWWQRTDFDSRLTDKVESSGFAIFEQIPIGFGAWMVGYGLVLVDDLLISRNQRIKKIDKTSSRHPDIEAEINQMNNGAIIAMANYAPRDDTNTTKNQNGSDFYLAITDSGLEIYATPLSFLSNLEARDRILCLYRIPTKEHPEFNGEHEQFRSARIVRSRRHPQHLSTIYQYSSREDLIKAKQEGTHITPIPEENRNGYTAFVDKFGNIKIELRDISIVNQLSVGEYCKLLITQDGITNKYIVQKAHNLKSASLNQLSVYINCSDQIDEKSSSGLVELIVRVNGNPSTSQKTAIYQIMEKLPNFDPRTASISIENS